MREMGKGIEMDGSLQKISSYVNRKSMVGHSWIMMICR